MQSIYKLCVAVLLATCMGYTMADDVKAEKGKPGEMLCYQCSSAKDSACGDPFDKKSLPLTNCSDEVSKPITMRNMKPVGCRKILQEVQDTTAVVRQCAYSDTPDHSEMKGVKHTGNAGVRRFVYQCLTSECNDATGYRPGLWLLTVAALLPASLALIMKF